MCLLVVKLEKTFIRNLLKIKTCLLTYLLLKKGSQFTD